MTAKKIDATRPLYAVVGVTDLAVEIARNYTADVQARFADVQTRVSKHSTAAEPSRPRT